MKILVTGGLGFIGSNFIIKLLQEKNDFDIINVDAEIFGSNPYNLDDIKNRINFQGKVAIESDGQGFTLTPWHIYQNNYKCEQKITSVRELKNDNKYFAFK